MSDERPLTTTAEIGRYAYRVSPDVEARVIDYWTNADAELGARVAAGLGTARRSVRPLDARACGT
jgi:catalase